MPRKSIFEQIAREWDDDAPDRVKDEHEALTNELSGTLTATTSPPSRSIVPPDDGADERPLPFDYSALSSRGRFEVMMSEARIIEIEKRSFVAIGRELRQIRDRIRQELGWGHWYGWLNMTKRARTTAAARIRAADWADESNSAIVAELSAAVAYRVAGADDQVKRQVLSLAAAGQKLTVRDVEMLIDKRPLLNAHVPAREKSPLMVPGSPDTTEAAHASAKRRGGTTAAQHLVAKLRARFNEREIANLLELWQSTTASDLRRALAKNRTAIVSQVTNAHASSREPS